eukprot:2790104-Pyramimonas_sp.AAC.1
MIPDVDPKKAVATKWDQNGDARSGVLNVYDRSTGLAFIQDNGRLLGGRIWKSDGCAPRRVKRTPVQEVALLNPAASAGLLSAISGQVRDNSWKYSPFAVLR